MGYNEKLWALFITYMLIQVFSPFYSTAYSTLAQVMSPNSNERADVLTVSTFIYSIAPSITGFLVPIISGYMGGMEHIDAYRVIMPVFSIGGAIFGLISYFGTKERIIVSKDYTPKVPFFKGIAAGIQNKHQWGLSIQGWFLLLQSGVGNITTWYFYYGIKDVLGLSTEQQGIMNGTLVTVIGFASTPAMLILGIVGNLLSLIPFISLYTLTEREHTSHIAVLKIRAALEDYATDSLSNGQLEEAKSIYASAVKEAREYEAALQGAAGREKKKLKKKLDAVNIIIDEKNRFETAQMKKKVEKANELLSHTVEELYGLSEPSMDRFNAANAMDESTREEMQKKDRALKEASKELDRFHRKAYDYIQARKLIKQLEYYRNWDGIFEAAVCD